MASPEKKVELLKQTLTALEELRRSIPKEDDFHSYLPPERVAYREAYEDEQDPPCRYTYQIDQRGVIVAVELPGSNLSKRKDNDDDFPF